MARNGSRGPGNISTAFWQGCGLGSILQVCILITKPLVLVFTSERTAKHEIRVENQAKVYREPGGATRIYELYRYVAHFRVWFLPF